MCAPARLSRYCPTSLLKFTPDLPILLMASLLSVTYFVVPPNASPSLGNTLLTIPAPSCNASDARYWLFINLPVASPNLPNPSPPLLLLLVCLAAELPMFPPAEAFAISRANSSESMSATLVIKKLLGKVRI